MGEQFGKNLGHHLPGKTELVLEPAALLRVWIAAFRQSLPVVIHFLLRRALDLEGDGFIKLEHRPAVEGRERLAVELELNSHHRAGWSAVDFLSGLTVTRDHCDLRFFEDGRVKARGLFGFVIKPEAR